MAAEVMKSLEQQKDSSMTDVKNKAEVSTKDGKWWEIGEKIKNRIEELTSTELLKDFSIRPQKEYLDSTNAKHTIINEALKNPENKDKIQTIQKELGYSKTWKIYYNPCRYDIQDGWTIRTKTPDGKAGPFTIGAINNMIADSKEPGELKVRNISSLQGVNDFVGSLHPYFYNKLMNPEMTKKFPENSNEKTIVDIMQKIQKPEVKKEDIQTMQRALHKLNVYPSIHNKEQKDGIPWPFTQIALQNFVFNYLK